MYVPPFRRLRAALSILLCLSLVVACSKHSSNNTSSSTSTTDTKTSYVRMINAIPDAPSLTLSQQSTVIGSAPYGQATTAYTTTASKTATFSVLYQSSDGITRTLTDNISVNVATTHEIYIVMYGTFASPQYTIIDNSAIVPQLDSNGNPIVSNKANVQFADTVNLGQSIDVYLTAYSDSLAGATPTATLKFGEVSPQVQFTAGTSYRIRVTPAGDSSTILYDSGKVSLTSDTNQIYLLDNYFGAGLAKLQAVSISSGIASSLVNANLPTEMRVANFIATAPSVDVYFGNTNVTPEYGNVSYLGYSSYKTFDPGAQFINVTPHGNNTTFLYQQNMTFSAGDVETLVLAGDPNSTSGVASVAVTEDNRPVATQLNLQFVDASANAGAVDFYVLQPGQPFTNATAASSGATFLSHATVPVATGSYDLVVTLHNQNTVIAGPTRISINVGNWTAVLADAPGGGPPYNLVISEDQ